MIDNCFKIGHRGAKGYLAENTLESIQKAMDFGVDGIEIDVHLCASGELVVFHDFTLDRITNGTGEVKKASLSELKNLRVQSQFLIPTLEEVLDLIDRKCFLNIELKGRNTASKTCEVIHNYIQNKSWSYKNFLVSSFQIRELEDVFKMDKNIPLGVLTKANIDEVMEAAKTINAFAIHPNYALLTSDNVKRAQDKNYKVYTWTVNDLATIQRMKSYGVDGIISDLPDRL